MLLMIIIAFFYLYLHNLFSFSIQIFLCNSIQIKQIPLLFSLQSQRQGGGRGEYPILSSHASIKMKKGDKLLI